MTSNVKITETTSGNARLTIIDPNPPGSTIIPTEDLFIYVSLKIKPKNRSVIELKGNGTSITNEKGVVINLIGTQIDSDGNDYMTTNWSNIGGNIDGSVTGDKNKETFGIKSISISYGADLLPKINITFIDLRGASMFDGFENVDENGVKSNISNYSSFFHIPYPIFELTIKGYYGKAVKYCLNMIKWYGNFTDGNFEIKAEFVMYNTSFLSDIIIDHVRGAMKTNDGYSELVNVYNKNSKGKTPLTIDDLLSNLGDIDKYVSDIKSDPSNKGKDIGYDTLVQLNTALTRLSEIKSMVGSPIGISNRENPNYFDLEGNYIKYNGLTPRTNIFAFRDILLITESAINQYYVNYRKDLITTIDSYEKELPKDFSEYSIVKKSNVNNVNELVPDVDQVKQSYELIPSINDILEGRDKGYKESSEFEKPPYGFTATTLSNGFGPKTLSQYFDYYDIRKTINDLYEGLTNTRKEYADKVAENINKAIDTKLSFNPNVGNIFEIICNNVEAYLGTIYKVALNAETKNDNRVKTLKGKLTDTSKDRIYAWPMLYNGKSEEQYIGSDDKISEQEPFFPELTYIEKLAAALVKKEGKQETQIVDINYRTFPINPADFYTPYNFTNFPESQKILLINTIIDRAMIAYDYSNFKNKIGDFANIEAASLYESTIDDSTISAIEKFLSEGSSSLVQLSESSQNILSSGGTFYKTSNISLNKDYSDISSYINGSTTLFFDIDLSPTTITDNFLNQPYSELYYNVKNALGNNKDLVSTFTPNNNENAEFNTSYYVVQEDVTTSCWEESVLDGGNFPIADKLTNYIGNVKSNYSQEVYELNNSISYQEINNSSFYASNIENLISPNEMKAMLIISTYPFKPIKELLSKLKDTSKIVSIPLSYMAWIGAHMLRQKIYKNSNVDVLSSWCNSNNLEFSSNQVDGVNNYINISSKINNSGELPLPFNDFNLFNDNINEKFISAFSKWTELIDGCGLLNFFDSNYNFGELNSILNSVQYKSTNQTSFLVSYTPNFWNLTSKPFFKMEESVLNNYLSLFSQKFSLLSQSKDRKVVNTMTPREVTNKDMKLSLYKTTKNLYDKWIGGTKNGKSYNSCGGFDEDVNRSLYSYFRFVDKDYGDISNIAALNLNSVVNAFNATNVTFLEIISRILRDNKYLFLPLPVYIDYTNMDEVKAIFEPSTFIKQASGSPSFIAMYNSGNSKYLDLSKNTTYAYANDGYDFGSDKNLPKNMVSSNDTNTKSIVAFRVAFGDENQSIFKNIGISQEEFTDTDESLRAFSDLVDNRGGTQRSFIGTNMYNVYSLRSYNLNFEMMGNAMIQPLMNLQLDNVPMFHGGYTITNVSHEISPNKMSTRVKAVRKSKYSVPVVTNATAFLPLDLNQSLKITTDTVVDDATTINDPVIEINTKNSFENPIEGKIFVGHKYGERRVNRNTGNVRYHKGVDIGVKENTPLRASWSGIVNQLFDAKGFGLYVILDHSNGQDKPFDDGYYYYTLYAHLNEVTIADKSQVNRGQFFAKSGGDISSPNRGNSTGAHLHYEIRRSKKRFKNIRQGYFSPEVEVLDPETFISYKLPTAEINENGEPYHGQLA